MAKKRWFLWSLIRSIIMWCCRAVCRMTRMLYVCVHVHEIFSNMLHLFLQSLSIVQQQPYLNMSFTYPLNRALNSRLFVHSLAHSFARSFIHLRARYGSSKVKERGAHKRKTTKSTNNNKNNNNSDDRIHTRYAYAAEHWYHPPPTRQKAKKLKWRKIKSDRSFFYHSFDMRSRLLTILI